MGGGKTCTGFDFIVDVITRVHDRLQKTRELEIHGLIFAMCFLTLMQGLARNCAPMCVNKKYLQGILYYLYNNYNSKVIESIYYGRIRQHPLTDGSSVMDLIDDKSGNF